MNEHFNIPKTIDTIKLEDIDEMVNYAYKETHPLYPVPVLWGKDKLKQIYMKVGGLNVE
jgi:hypothetical protein